MQVKSNKGHLIIFNSSVMRYVQEIMRKGIFLMLILVSPALLAELTLEQDEEEDGPWIYAGFFSQQLNQVSFSNWVQGGENSVASTSVINLGAKYKQDRLTWENRLNMAFGIIKTEDAPLRKNEDRLHLISKAGREVSPHFSTSFLLDFRSQFYKGYNYPNDSVVVSRFMSPGVLSLSLGMDYKPWEFLSVFLSPVSGKFTFVTDQDLANRGSFGVDPAEYDEDGNLISEGSNVNAEFGALLNLVFEKEVFEDIQVESRLTLFNNLIDDDSSNRKNTDVDWETTVNLKINRYITASLFVYMLYDHDTPIPVHDDDGVETGEYTRKMQVKQMLGIGLSYRF